MADLETSALNEAEKLVKDIEAVVVPSEHRYAGMVTTKLNEAKTWASKMVEELSGGEVSADQADAAENSAQDEGDAKQPGEGASADTTGTDGADKSAKPAAGAADGTTK